MCECVSLARTSKVEERQTDRHTDTGGGQGGRLYRTACKLNAVQRTPESSPSWNEGWTDECSSPAQSPSAHQLTDWLILVFTGAEKLALWLQLLAVRRQKKKEKNYNNKTTAHHKELSQSFSYRIVTHRIASHRIVNLLSSAYKRKIKSSAKRRSNFIDFAFYIHFYRVHWIAFVKQT